MKMRIMAKFKAQNVIEIALLAVVVVIAAIYVLGLFNNQKTKLADMSSIHIKSVNLQTMSSNTASKKIATSKSQVETAGALSLKLLGMNSSSEFETAMTNIKYSDLKAALEDTDSNGQNIATLANSLIDQYGLSDQKISADNISNDTLNTLTDVLNSVASNNDSSDTAKAYTQRLQTLINSANSSK